MNRRLVAGAIATAVILGVSACSGEGSDVAAPTTPGRSASSSATASPMPSASATPAAAPSATSSSAPGPANPANPANSPRPPSGSTGSDPVTSPPAPDPNAAYCQTFETILTLSSEMVAVSLTLGFSTDPDEVEQAWQELEDIAERIAALARQAMGQTDDPVLQAFAQVFATQFDYIAAAAAARDMAALESIPEPDLSDLPETPDGYAPCGYLIEG